jgi:hypothetical protein
MSDVATLAWCATLATLEVLRSCIAFRGSIRRPRSCSISGTNLLTCGEVALLLREALAGVLAVRSRLAREGW